MSLFKRKKKYDYFAFFNEISSGTVEAAAYLKDVLTNYDKTSLKEQVDTMHKIEETADLKKKDMLENLIDEFLPPIDKEDIINLSHKIDDVIDAIDEVLITYYTFNIHTVTDEALQFANIIEKASVEMNKCLASLKLFKKSNEIFDHINNVNHIKSEGEKFYKLTIAGLYQSNPEDHLIVKYTEIYKTMRQCYLLCKEVTNAVEKIVMKNL